ncbi:MAG: amidohydrolase family protein [Oscillibacter sp.]|jgi:dihydroorotase|nr:amidohydrolase family protein [Oscillibacter sp.]
MRFDTVISSGQVFDSTNGRFEKRDVFIQNGIVQPAPTGEYEYAVKIDASGKYVVPGLIDEHAHLNLYGTIIGANADTMCIPNGVTTACDGGSCGASNFVQFYNSNIVRYEPDVLSYLNVSTFGNKSLCKHEEDHDPADFREDLIQNLFHRYPDTLRGLKVRMCKATLGDYGMAPLRRAMEISETLKKEGFRCPVAIHYDDLPENVSVQELFDCMRPGDVVAHVYQTKGETIFDEHGQIKPAVQRARERGVWMDDCHGRVHWSFPNLKRAFAQEFYPDIVSSDLVRVSEYIRPGFSLPFAMSVLSAAGAPTEKILQAVTYTPAKALGILDRAGTLETGRPADVAILDLKETDQVFTDHYGNTCKGNLLFIPLLTMKSGRVAFRQIFF